MVHRTLLTEDEVRRIARLARLDLSDEEVALLTPQLGDVLLYVEQLAELDTTGVVATFDAAPVGRFRPLGLRVELAPGEATAAAPDAWEGSFRVPQVIG